MELHGIYYVWGSNDSIGIRVQIYKTNPFCKNKFPMPTISAQTEMENKKQHEETRTIQFDNQISDYIYHFN